MTTYSTSLTPRYYECNPFEEAHPANYLRWATQTALEASAAVGYGMDQYQALGALWLLREAHLELVRPAKFGAALTLKTWVQDFRRVRSRRAFELLDATNTPLARLNTDWVYISREDGQPASIPTEMQKAFLPNGEPKDAPARERFPDLPEPPREAFRARRRVTWHQHDTAGHLNSAWYLDWLTEVNDDAATKQGWHAGRTDQLGLAFVPRELHIEYLQPAHLDDDVEILAYVGGVNETQVLWHYIFRHAERTRQDEHFAHAYATWECCSLEDDAPRRVPDEWVADFNELMADTEAVEAADADNTENRYRWDDDLNDEPTRWP